MLSDQGTWQIINKITGESKEILGVTIYNDLIDNLFVIIFVNQHETKENVLDTVIHKIVHSREKTGGAPDEKECCKFGRKLTTEIQCHTMQISQAILNIYTICKTSKVKDESLTSHHKLEATSAVC